MKLRDGVLNGEAIAWSLAEARGNLLTHWVELRHEPSDEDG